MRSNMKISVILTLMIMLLNTSICYAEGGFLKKLSEARDQFRKSVLSETKGVFTQEDAELYDDEQEVSKLPISNILPLLDESLSKDEMYPRVAITVLKAPSNHKEKLGTKISRSLQAQYVLQARIWEDKDTFHDTEEFTWDIQRNYVYNFPLNDYQRWALGFLSFNNTGIKRTKGPLWPAKPLPNDRKHKSFFGVNYPYSMDYFMMCCLAYIAGVEPESHDSRLWIVEFKDAE